MTQTTQPDPEVLEALPVRAGPGRTVGLVVAWVVAIAAVVALGWFAWFQLIDPGGGSTVGSYVNGGGTTFVSKHGGFTVKMPTSPTERTQSTPTGPATVVESRPGSDYRFTVTWNSESSDALADATATLDTAAGTLASDVGGSIDHQGRVVDFGNFAVKDLVYAKGATKYHTRIVLSLDRLYVVQVITNKNGTKAFDRLAQSFRLLAS